MLTKGLLELNRLMLRLAPAVQEHAGAAARSAGEEGAPGLTNAEMLHHVTDSHSISLEPFGTIHLPTLPTVHVGGLAIDFSITRHVFFLTIAAILTVLTMWLAARASYRLEHGEEAPSGVLNGVEAFYLYLRDEVALRNIGHGGEGFVPYVIALFFFILYANLLGLVPWGATATSNIMVTGALAAISFVVVEVSGFAALGPKGYLRTIFYTPHGLNPVMAAMMLVVMTPIELIGKLAKPFALAIRLFANMNAGHFVILSLMGMIIAFGGMTATGVVAIVGPILLGLFVMFLEIFVAFLQAYIFALLTAVFIGLIREAH